MLRYAMFLLLAVLTSALQADAQSPAADRGVYLTAFRSPASGLEFRTGHIAANAGFYPTILSRDGARHNVNFVRAGASFYLEPKGNSLYVSPSVLWSLNDAWRNGVLSEVGFRGSLHRRVYGRLGAAVLTSFDGRVHVNPTVGLDIKLGKLASSGAGR